MLALAVYALYQGQLAWLVFISGIGLGIMWEWVGLARRIAADRAALAGWIIGGIVYLLAAGSTLLQIHWIGGSMLVFAFAGSVVMTDVGAYFAGRAIGGRKIAPSISPSKTWSGLIGGMAACALWLAGFAWALTADGAAAPGYVIAALLLGPVVAAVAQAGDFFESWMKRRAGVKDSGDLIPGHGGLFDRMDGMLAVAALLALPVALLRL